MAEDDKYALDDEDNEFIDQMEKFYKFDSIIGRGGFGMVFKAVNVSNGKDVAIKVQKRFGYKKVAGRMKKLPLKNRLNTEKDIILTLKKENNKIGIPEIIEVGSTDNHHYMVITLLGPSLKTVLREMGTISTDTAFEIGTQILDTLEQMHNAGFVHRDIKLQNILTGLDGDRKFYLVDFGLTQQHAEKFATGYNIVGTTKYVSINVHRGYEYSWCDDLESLGYLMLRLIIGHLPWTDDMEDDEIMDMKENLVLKGALNDYMLYVDELRFGERPDYNLLRQFLHHKQEPYDWE